LNTVHCLQSVNTLLELSGYLQEVLFKLERDRLWIFCNLCDTLCCST